MKINARLTNSEGQHRVTLHTDDSVQSLSISPKPSGFGSSMNGGEALFLALATCYCNDVYREAAKRGMKIEKVEVEVDGEFGAEGEPARNVTYRARVTARASAEEINDLMHHVDQVAEVQNTLRLGTTVTLRSAEAVAQ